MDKNIKKKQRRLQRDWKDKEYLNGIIEEVERAKSNNSTCCACHQRIGKNTLRGICQIPKKNLGYTIRAKYCSDCSISSLVLQRNRIKHAIAKIKRIKRSRKVAYENQEEMRNKDKILKVIEEKDG